jgi:hypothetical protein
VPAVRPADDAKRGTPAELPPADAQYSMEGLIRDDRGVRMAPEGED